MVSRVKVVERWIVRVERNDVSGYFIIRLTFICDVSCLRAPGGILYAGDISAGSARGRCARNRTTRNTKANMSGSLINKYEVDCRERSVSGVTCACTCHM